MSGTTVGHLNAVDPQYLWGSGTTCEELKSLNTETPLETLITAKSNSQHALKCINTPNRILQKLTETLCSWDSSQSTPRKMNGAPKLTALQLPANSMSDVFENFRYALQKSLPLGGISPNNLESCST